MKKILLIIAVTLITVFTTFAQQENNIDDLTDEKWNIEFVEIENEIIDVKDEGHWMIFHSNGLYQILLDDEEQIGTWNLDEKLGINFDNKAANGKSAIKKINENELKFSLSGYTIALTKAAI